MNWIVDQNYLRTEQYQDPDRLNKRIQLHARFSRNKYGWTRWVFEQINIQRGMQILEAGCGMGTLWRENLNRLPREVEVVLVDLSHGMVLDANQSLRVDERFQFITADAQNLPLKNSKFNVIIANHMLYHIPDIKKAMDEFWRILMPGGLFIAATNGMEHLQELYDLVEEVVRVSLPRNDSAQRFGLENAPEIIGRIFINPEIIVYEDSLWVDQAQPLVDYILTMWTFQKVLTADKLPRLVDLIQQRIQNDGGIYITKSTGIIRGYKV